MRIFATAGLILVAGTLVANKMVKNRGNLKDGLMRRIFTIYAILLYDRYAWLDRRMMIWFKYLAEQNPNVRVTLSHQDPINKPEDHGPVACCVRRTTSD